MWKPTIPNTSAGNDFDVATVDPEEEDNVFENIEELKEYLLDGEDAGESR